MIDYQRTKFFWCVAGDEEDREASQNTGSSADRAFTAAWAKVYGTNGANPAATSRLATDWSTQHSLAQQAQANIQPAVMSLVVASHQQAAETIPAATNQAVVAQQHPAQFALSPAGEDDVEYALAADEPMAEPAGEDDFHDAAANDEPETVQPQAMAAFASPGQTPQQTARPVTVSFPNTRQQQHDVGTSVSTATPLPAAQNNAKQQAGAVQGSPLAARKAAIRASSVSPHSGGLAGLAPPAAPGQKVHKQAATQMPDLDTQAMQLAMQVICTALLVYACLCWCLGHNMCISTAVCSMQEWMLFAAHDFPFTIQYVPHAIRCDSAAALSLIQA